MRASIFVMHLRRRSRSTYSAEHCHSTDDLRDQRVGVDLIRRDERTEPLEIGDDGRHVDRAFVRRLLLMLLREPNLPRAGDDRLGSLAFVQVPLGDSACERSDGAVRCVDDECVAVM
jgi:hypothetical protein